MLSADFNLCLLESAKDTFKSLNDLLKVRAHLDILLLCYLGCDLCKFQLMIVRKSDKDMVKSFKEVLKERTYWTPSY